MYGMNNNVDLYYVPVKTHSTESMSPPCVVKCLILPVTRLFMSGI